LTFDPSGGFRYVPHIGYIGTDQFTYRVIDPSGAAAFATVRIEVQGHPPTGISLDNQLVYERVLGAIVANVEVADADASDVHTFSVSDDRFEVHEGQLRLKTDVAVDASLESNISLTITATDSGGLSVTTAFELTVAENEQPWLNPVRALDVSNDQEVTPLDALLIINELNRRGPGPLPAMAGGETMRFFDPSGDGMIAPFDALLIINFLNVGGEGEASPTPQTPRAVAESPASFTLNQPAVDIDAALMWFLYEGHPTASSTSADAIDDDLRDDVANLD
jgi:hypothetical protein